MMHELALEFKNKGHDVTVLTPKPAQNKHLVVEKLDGVTVLYFRSGKIKNTGKIKRAINETLLSFYAWTGKQLLAERFSVQNACQQVVNKL